MYVRDLRTILHDFSAEVVAFFDREIGTRADGLREWDKGFDELLRREARKIPARVSSAFGRMAQTAKDKGGKAAAKELGIKFTDLGVDLEIGKALEANVQLVEKAGRSYAKSVREVVTDPQNVGLPWQDVKAKLLEKGGVSESRAELIARDQTLKLSSKIAETRMRNAGIFSYEWSTSRDDRVRPGHKALEGTTQRFDAPPVVDPKAGRRCNPGEDYQCRCVAIPVIEEALAAAPEVIASPALPAPPKPKAPPPAPLHEVFANLSAPENQVKARAGMRSLLGEELSLGKPIPAAGLEVQDIPMPGVHKENGLLIVQPRIARGAQRALADLAGGRTPDLQDAKDLRVVFHEELHSYSPVGKGAYSGTGLMIEEATTELLARRAIKTKAPELAHAFATRTPGMAYERFLVNIEDAIADIVPAGKVDKVFVSASQRFKRRPTRGLRSPDAVRDAFLDDILQEAKIPKKQRASALESLRRRMP